MEKLSVLSKWKLLTSYNHGHCEAKNSIVGVKQVRHSTLVTN